MSTLKSTEKDKVKFLLDFDYSNVLGRLKFVLGKEASFFADIRVRQNDVTWSTKDDKEYSAFIDANDSEKQIIKEAVDSQIEKLSSIISGDSLIGPHTEKIISFPSNQYIYYTVKDGIYNVILTGWGCEAIKLNEREQTIVKDKAQETLTNEALHEKTNIPEVKPKRVSNEKVIREKDVVRVHDEQQKNNPKAKIHEIVLKWFLFGFILLLNIPILLLFLVGCKSALLVSTFLLFLLYLTWRGWWKLFVKRYKMGVWMLVASCLAGMQHITFVATDPYLKDWEVQEIGRIYMVQTTFFAILITLFISSICIMILNISNDSKYSWSKMKAFDKIPINYIDLFLSVLLPLSSFFMIYFSF